MDRQSHDFNASPPPPAAIALHQQQRQPPPNMQPQPQPQQQQQQFGFHPQPQHQHHHHQFGFHPQPQPQPPPQHHPSMQPFPYVHLQPQPQPHLLPQPHPPPPFPPPHLYPSPFPPAPAPPPSDPDLLKRIDKLVEYSLKNGPQFELMIREKQQDNPAYSFLFGGDGHNYYRYKFWISTHPPPPAFNPPFPQNPIISPAPMPFPPFYDHHHHHPFGPPRLDFDPNSFKSLSAPLPPDVAMELNNVLNTLNGTKDSIKGAKIWFMQRSPFAPALAEALRDRIFALNDAERQLHIIYLANDILFDSLQRRANPHELDNMALAFKPVLGSMLARVYHNPQCKDENQPRLQKILQYWASNQIYDQDTIYALEGEMVGGPPANYFSGPPKDLSTSSDSSVPAGFTQQPINHNIPHWQPDRQNVPDQEHPDQQNPLPMPPSLGNQQFMPSSVSAGAFPRSVPINSSVLPVNQQPAPNSLQAPHANVGEKLPPYPLFPPGLIPGMVKKMQIGSGVPYSPLSPLDIPTIIPPSNVSPSEVLERVSKFFKEIGEVNPIEGSVNSSLGEDDEYERDPPIRKGGACIPPPLNLQVDPETGTYPDGSVEKKPGSASSGRLGLGAMADPNEASQYDDVYTSYRKQQSTTYHSSMSARAATR